MSAATSYDEVLYHGAAQHQTHPDRLATLATLYGLRPAPVEHCRVLEIACGDGANLLSMAVGLPESRFLGIDLAQSGIDQGNRVVADLGLKNLTLRQHDLMAASADLGQFDYIIAHGLYSWVPPQVRDRLLAVCKTLLAPQGVAYISYNTYPGCHVRQMLREMLRFHTRQIDSPADKIRQARQLAEFLADAQTGDDLDRQYYKKELEKLKGHPDHLFYHDDLADLNTPSYFVQFIAHAGQHGLQFVAEADFCEMQDIFYPQAVTDALRKMTGDQVLLKEQYLDFIKCRRFRRTLLCHQEAVLDRALDPSLAQRFLASSSAAPVSAQPDLRTDAEEEFAGRAGGHLRTNQPVVKALLVVLSEAWPAPLSFRETLARVRTLLGPDEQAATSSQDTSPTALEAVLMNSFATGLLQFHLHVPRFARQPSVRPVASPLARWQVLHGRNTVTNLFHSSIDIAEPVGRQLIRLLDGSRDRPQLQRDLVEAIEAGTVPLEEHGEAVRDPRRIRELIARDLETSLSSLAKLGLLVQ
jgi:methyltransferase-like protein/SAM-dependent methyltransferase